MIKYRDEEIERLEKKQKEMKIVAKHALEACLEMVINHEDKYYANQGFSYAQWKQLEKDFLGYEHKEKKFKDHSKFINDSGE